MWKDERGFFLVDVLALCCIVAAFASCIGLFRMSAQMRHGAAMRVAATYLAETQIGCLEELAWHEALREDEYPWQGEPGDLHQQGADFNVRAFVRERHGDVCRVEAITQWTRDGRREEVALERLIRPNE